MNEGYMEKEKKETRLQEG